MIWRIFKKDWTLLWPLVAVVAALHAINAVIWLISGFFGIRELTPIANIFPAGVLLGTGALIVATVHQDVLPGDRQDWLVRPIPRRDLVLEKLLFVLVAVNGPVLLVELIHGMAMGFSFADAFSAALTRDIYLLLYFNLPVLGLAALTSSFIEAVGAFLAICVVMVVIRIGIIAVIGGNPRVPTFATMANGEMLFELWNLIALAVVAVVIPLQYFFRATRRARLIAFCALFLLPLAAGIPWSSAFAFQSWLSADPQAAKAVALTFDPTIGRAALQPGTQANALWVPVRLSGLASESIVLDDRAFVRIIGRDGTTLYRGLVIGEPQATNRIDAPPASVDDLPVRTATGGEVRTHQLIALPHRIYEGVRDQPVRLEMDYSLTLFHLDASDRIAAVNGDKWIAHLGRCKTKIDDDGDEIEISCLKTGGNVTCGTAFLENAVTGARNPPYSFCNRYYPPIPAHFIPDAMSRFRGELHFRDPQGLAKYPVD
ncbi:MAG TPA: hypothetical protein VFA87_07155, partial [Rhizomicrobium sp.]|nr:hypothetical protein [Rhizomicrobium sp.]